MKPIPKEIDTKRNSEILQFLRGKSCHGDIVIPIEACLQEYNDVKAYCPDGVNFSYVCWYVDNIIFAYAEGMRDVSFQLAQTGDLDIAKLETTESFKKCSNWYSVPYNSSSLKALVSSSYRSAKNT